MSFGDAVLRVGEGILNVTGRAAISVWNAHREERIREIDEEIKTLQEERDQLVSELITDDKTEK